MRSGVLITATLPVTSVSTRRTPGVLGWHQAETVLVLGQADGHLDFERMAAITFCSDESVLQRDTTYTITGQFGQDPTTKRPMLRHNAMSQVDVGPFASSLDNLAGRAHLSAIGQVKSVHFEEGTRMGMPWNAVVVVKHDYVDPLTAGPRQNHFRHYTPLPSYWGELDVGVTVCINASLIGKDKETSSFVAQAVAYLWFKRHAATSASSARPQSVLFRHWLNEPLGYRAQP
ncbi:uncharacterized protein MELLADRAFT_95677 [Melampsora larici-populina 98AG31]|uniref:Uncharacterized protein n=1 Tax=Melampsora larici-populina (strain 98AG31 / pathotype 3-4-7) TaxID=747676 RepID=F4SA75_MELLP|nr:uncharacterized protein MELLADRAFT_95677 [Melampsora larici-populina 98AG31]EGF98405.1 hypothetical protein MELLADRAFT_95677 [Melampsora larici-populina 98AG31]